MAIKSKRYSQSGPAVDKDDAAIADAKGSSTKAIKSGRGGSTKKHSVKRSFGKRGL